MILVLLGTQDNSFNRLLEKIEQLIKNEIIQDEVIVQAGYTKYTSEKMKIIDFLKKEDLEELLNKADLIITHGGVGSILLAITRSKKVIAVPRLHEYKEHVNDHQKEIVSLFNQKGYIIGIQKVEELERAIKQVKTFLPKKYKSNNKKILNIIEEFIDKL